jgi:1-acyl-sn-glycerol-3-phosphate acyltransferase
MKRIGLVTSNFFTSPTFPPRDVRIFFLFVAIPTKNIMGKITRILKYLLKQAIIHNPLDAAYERSRKKHIKKGDLDIWEHHLYWRIGKRLSTAIAKLFNKITWNNRDHELPLGPFVVVANHATHIDPLYIGTCFWWKIAWLSKKGNFQAPIFKTLIGAMGAISLKNGAKTQDGKIDQLMDQETIDQIDHAIRRKHAIGIFPEGHRNTDGKLHKFRSGAARLCLDYGLPYIPVAISGSRVPFKGRARVNIGKPVYLAPNLPCSFENAVAIAEDMRTQVQALLNNEPQPKSRFEVINPTRKVEPKYSYEFFKPSIHLMREKMAQLKTAAARLTYTTSQRLELDEPIKSYH